MSRAPARKGRQDSNHKAIADAIRVLGFPVMDLSAAGNGVEDLLVGISVSTDSWERPLIERRWLLVEAKNLKGRGLRFTPAQLEWRALTADWPRITATSAADAIAQIREMTR